MKVVINSCFGGFNLSEKAEDYLGCSGFDYRDDEKRTDPKLIKCVEKLGASANGMGADLKIVEIPDGVEYVIEEYDGMEHVAEKHQTWY